jgi:hypothetical protein
MPLFLARELYRPIIIRYFCEHLRFRTLAYREPHCRHGGSAHLLSDHAKAAHAAGWTLAEFDEGTIDSDWLAKKPKWEADAGVPISFAMVWRKGKESRTS